MGPDPIERAARLIEKLGPRLILQVREKDLTARALVDWVLALLPTAEASGAELSINGRADVARAFAPRVGLHLSEDGIPVREARRLLPDVSINASVHSAQAAVEAAIAGADRVTVGAVFETPSKQALGRPPIGLLELKRAVGLVAGRAEVFALGGIDRDRAASVLETGVAGIGAIRAVWLEGWHGEATR
jgi:thiamine-phosphate pyrophosphorylase